MMEHYLLWIFLLIMMSQHVFGCFPIQDIFDQSTLWSQDLRKPWRRLYTIGQESDNFMKVEHQAPGGRITYSDVTCLRAYSGHRYLVKVELENWPVMFKCLRFTPLTQRVVRKAETNDINVQARVNCETDVYIEDEELMLAYRVLRVLTKRECPLTGGFQLIPQGGGAKIGDQCLDSLHTYNPRLEFACGGDHVLIDLGEKCAPVIPVQDQSPWRMKYSQMECLDSWDEPGGEVKAILLKKRYDYWCLLYKVIKDGNGERLSVYLSFRAKCSGQVFNSTNQVSTDEFATFGTLVKYVSSFDDRCHKENHIHQCGSPESDSKCFKSNKCPSKCGRCNENIVKNDCRFNKVVGNWISADSSLDLSVNVKTQNIQVSGYGTFYCWKYNTSYGDVYPVVRNDAHSSCLPLYACAKLSTPCPGVLNFFLTIDKRDSETGKPLGCSHLPYGESILIPPMNGMLVTLLDTKKLPTVSCNIQRDMLFPSSQFGRCKFLLKKSIGSCSTLNAGIDFASCGTDMLDNVDREHTCHAKIQLLAGVRGIITSSVHNNRYRCWIFTKSNLYITSPDKCNSKSAYDILQDYRSANRYDPFLAITQSGDDANCLSGNITMYIIVLASWLLPFLPF